MTTSNSAHLRTTIADLNTSFMQHSANADALAGQTCDADGSCIEEPGDECSCTSIEAAQAKAMYHATRAQAAAAMANTLALILVNPDA